MARTAEHTHQIRIRETQLEMHPDAPVGSSPLTADYEGRLEAAQEQLEQLQQQREQLERRKRELEELNKRKKAFIGSQAELIDKLTNTVTLIDRELFAMRKETEELEGARQCFAEHIATIDRLDPETWSGHNVGENLELALAAIEEAENDYDLAVQHFTGMRSATIFGARRKRAATRGRPEFLLNLVNGFAFNLPVVLLGATALVLYYLR
jgi:DNA repair exonuclease SbcCD ATPase subunit